MKTRDTMALAMLLGAGVGAVAVQSIHAQAKPPVYVINEVDVTDQKGFQTYVDNNRKLVEKHGGRYIIQGGKVVATLSGTAPTGRYTIYSFDSEEKMRAWRDDPGQKDVVATRDKVAKFRSFAVEGLSR
jgi:uncharacterized protein (DUF1330 family)